LQDSATHDAVYQALKRAPQPLTAQEVIQATGSAVSEVEFARKISDLARDFELHVDGEGAERTYSLGRFRGFVGQADHVRHAAYDVARSKIS
jgi:DNA (cytosine-5)-methyltransferase 1